MNSPFHVSSVDFIGQGSTAVITISTTDKSFVAALVTNENEIPRQLALAQLFASAPLLLSALESILKNPTNTTEAKTAIAAARKSIQPPTHRPQKS
jgi:hypothetical protein